jgi:hypothetical protein
MKKTVLIISCGLCLLLIFVALSCERMGIAASENPRDILPFVKCTEEQNDIKNKDCTPAIRAVDKESELFMRAQKQLPRRALV